MGVRRRKRGGPRVIPSQVSRIRGRQTHDLAQQIVASACAKPGTPTTKIVEAEEDERQGSFHPLHAVGFSEKHGEQGIAVVDGGKWI
jgi:hypothetical protein